MTSDATIPAVFTGSRLSTFRYDLLDLDDRIIGSIDGVTGGSLQWSAGTAVKVSGSLTVFDVDGIDWLNSRVQVWRTVGDREWSRGIFIPSAPQDRWVNGVRQWQVELLGKLSLLEQDEQPGWVSVAAGANIIATVRALLTSAGQTNVRITDSTATLRTSQTWEPGTKLLTIINELLDSAGYWSLSADVDGAFVAEPYVRPAARSPRYDLWDDEHGIYKDDFTRDQDVYSIPNRIVLISQSGAETPPLVGIAENNDPTSRFSIGARGQVITYQETGLEVASQAVLDELARKKLIEKSSVSASLVIQHAPIPLDLNDAVHFRREPAGIDGNHTVQAMNEPLDASGLMQTTLREVVDL